MKKILLFCSLISGDIVFAQNAPVIQNITVPAPALDNSSMTYRNAIIDMQFSAQNKDLFYIKNQGGLDLINQDDMTIYSVNEKKHIGIASIPTLIESNNGREALIDFQNNNKRIQKEGEMYQYGIYTTNYQNATQNFIDATYKIVFNNNKSVRFDNDAAIPISIFNHKNQTTEQSITDFKFWKNTDSLSVFIKSEKEKYLEFAKKYYAYQYKGIKKEYSEHYKKSMYYLGGIKARYDPAKQVAHIVIKIEINNLWGSSLYNYYSTFNFLYEIDFKHKSYTKLASSHYPITLKDNYCAWIPIENEPIDNETIYDRPIKSILYFDEYSTTVFDNAYINRLNQLTTPAADVKFEFANNLYLIFKEKAPGSRYYFVNRQTNVCEKIVNLRLPYKDINMVWDDNSLKSAIQLYNDPGFSSKNHATSIYIIDWNTLRADILDDHGNQQAYANRTNAYMVQAEINREAFYKSLDEQNARDRKSRQENEEIENTINKNWEKAKAIKQLPLFPTKVTYYYWGTDGQKHIID
ncbi:hypothetical protein [Ferruginibacter sp.]|nr:hypothetical protein [Ferruginibacter sp.]